MCVCGVIVTIDMRELRLQESFGFFCLICFANITRITWKQSYIIQIPMRKIISIISFEYLCNMCLLHQSALDHLDQLSIYSFLYFIDCHCLIVVVSLPCFPINLAFPPASMPPPQATDHLPRKHHMLRSSVGYH